MAKAKKSENVPKTMQDTFARIVNLTDSVARQHLNDEYAQLIRYAAAALLSRLPNLTPVTMVAGGDTSEQTRLAL
jgi:hypothetical protein